VNFKETIRLDQELVELPKLIALIRDGSNGAKHSLRYWRTADTVRQRQNLFLDLRGKAQHEIARVLYPELPDFPQHELAKSQMSGFGGMLTLEIDGSGDDMILISLILRSPASFVTNAYGAENSLLNI